MGHVSVSSLPGGFIQVDIVGRTDALGPVVPLSRACDVILGGRVQVQRVDLDDTGSGTARFGPLDQDRWGISGTCGTHLPPESDKNANLNLTAPHPPACSDCSTRGYVVVLDGGAPVTGPSYPVPAAPADAPQANCADDLSKNMSKLPPGTEVALDKLKAIPKRASLYAYATCTLVDFATSSNPADDQNLFNDVCKSLENATDVFGIEATKDFFCGTPVS